MLVVEESVVVGVWLSGVVGYSLGREVVRRFGWVEWGLEWGLGWVVELLVLLGRWLEECRVCWENGL